LTVAVARDQPDLVAEAEPVGGGGDGEPAVLVGGALIGGGGLVADERRTRIEGERLQPASTMARSSVGRLITVAQTKRLGAPSRSILRP
jgi:hypothetical protein